MEIELDKYFMVVCKEVGGIQQLLDAFFDFMRRRTDFFYEMDPGDTMGFEPGANVQMLLRSFKKQQDEHYKKFPKKDPVEFKEKLEKYREAQQKKKEAEKIKQQKVVEKVEVVKKNEQIKTQTTVVQQKPKQSQATNKTLIKPSQIVSTYNGGQTDKYTWSQESRDIVVTIPLPPNTKSKQLEVKLQSQHLKVLLKKTQQVIIQGEFYEKIRAGVNDSTWIVQTNKGSTTLVLNLQKADERIWSTILKGDKQIDTTKVQNTKNLSDFDQQTQAAIEKLRYDQDQKMKGLPTSDELKQRQILQKAWNAEGSPFKGTPFDPSKLNLQGFKPQ